MHPNKMIAGRNGCLRLMLKIAFPFGWIPSTKTMTTRLTNKIEMKIQQNIVEMVVSCDNIILMKIVKVAANKPVLYENGAQQIIRITNGSYNQWMESKFEIQLTVSGQ